MKPSSKNCADKKCEKLVWKMQGLNRQRICELTGRIPGNMGTCPFEESAATEVI